LFCYHLPVLATKWTGISYQLFRMPTLPASLRPLLGGGWGVGLFAITYHLPVLATKWTGISQAPITHYNYQTH